MTSTEPMKLIEPAERERLTLAAVDVVELYGQGMSINDLVELIHPGDDLGHTYDPDEVDALHGLILLVQLMQASYHIATAAPLEGMADAARATAKAWRQKATG